VRRPVIGVSAALVLGGVIAVIVLTTDGGSARKSAGPIGLPALVKTGGFFSARTFTAAGPAGRSPLLENKFEGPIDVADAAYALRAFPAGGVTFAEATAARRGFAGLTARLRLSLARSDRQSAAWKPLGAARFQALPAPFLSGATRSYLTSGRVTALAVAPRCAAGDCRLWVGTAGGGVFRTDDALAASPRWVSVSTGLTSSAIGSVVLDPNDASGNTLYVGTGEEAGSADSEAGTGVFRSTDGGNTWSILPGSVATAKDRAVPSIAIDPGDPRTIYMATAISLHGSTEPPGAAPLGLYLSKDGGRTFTKVFSKEIPDENGITVAASVNQVAFDPNDSGTVYVAVTAAGLYRRSQQFDGDGAFHKVFRTLNVDPLSTHPVRFALADLGSTTRIYLGDSSDEIYGPRAELFRVDDASVPWTTVLGASGTNEGWKELSSSEPSVVGFDSYNYCGQQCSYDNVVATPPGQPDSVWLGGFFDYGEAYAGASNGRATLRSTDAGAHFTDLTADARTPPMLQHPDEHAIAFAPGHPDIAFIGSDGGVARTSGKFASSSSTCANRRFPRAVLARCRRLLSAVPTELTSLNDGLQSLQLYSISVGPEEGTILTGSQDNGTWEYSPRAGWRQTAGGDGGQSGFAPGSSQIRFHTYYETSIEVNFHGFDPHGWDLIAAPLIASEEHVSFYAPLVVDPVVAGRVFVGLEHVWRTTDYGGSRRVLDARCNREKLTQELPSVCGDWKPLGANLTAGGRAFGRDRKGYFVVNVAVAPSDEKTVWAATLPGRVFISKNADARPARVRFGRIDLRGGGSQNSTPGRLVSAIVVDDKDPNHAWVSFSGYDAHTPADMPGHVFDVRFDPTTGDATWTNQSYNLPDMPITALVREQRSGDLYASTDFGVLRLAAGAHAWTDAAPGLPTVAVYGLTISRDGRTLYAATHGRAAWSLSLPS
jgi:hypothetical protein